MKTNQLKLLALALLIGGARELRALEPFECVRDLLPITEQAAFQSRRQGVESPFMIGERFMVFPEVREGAVTGFYIYASGHAAYYDSIEMPGTKSKRTLTELRRTNAFTLYNLIAQPLGLETVSFSFMPALNRRESNRGGPVILGSSVMPVVGAMMSRPSSQLNLAYRDPGEMDGEELRDWVHRQSSRGPAANAEVESQIAHLALQKPKSTSELWKPLRSEVELRKTWVKTHNLDESSFKTLSRVMDTSCKP